MKTFLPFLLIMLLWGCGNNKPPTPPPAETPQTATPAEPGEGAAETPDKAAHPILGSYVGLFEAKTYDANQNISWSNKITVFLDSIAGDRLYGHSVVAGNARPFSGPLRRQGETFVAEVREPGDDRYDGQFFLTIDGNGKKIAGTWRSFKKLGVSERQYNLERRQFRYDPKLELPEETGWADLYNSYDEKTGKAEFLTEDVTKYNASARLLKKRRGGKPVQIGPGSDPQRHLRPSRLLLQKPPHALCVRQLRGLVHARFSRYSRSVDGC